MPSAEPSTRPVSARGLPWTLVVVVLAAAVFAWAWWSVDPDADVGGPPLPIIVAVPEFSLTERSGRVVTRDDLKGLVWVADFIYSQCPGPCPTLSARFRGLQNTLSRERQRVRLVSITLDPKQDTPPVLAEYARRFNADSEMWLFLTGGSEAETRALVEKGFLQSVFPGSGDNPLIHSNYVAVVDVEGRIRAFHDGLDPASAKRTVRDVKKLLAEAAHP
ncbi:MAG: SCO family protein [Planctomycetes bacterium]|nr:SCO family protein [Planctomycetota bacterium]